MANRSDNRPKQFRQMPCARCGEIFQATGPSAKRCDPCRAEHKREYERVSKRARCKRRAACMECGEPFPKKVHAHQLRCNECARKVHSRQTIDSYLRRYRREFRHDPAWRLHNSVATLVRRSLGSKKAGRKWESMVGYSVADLRRHLERQFTKGMTWENYGAEWHVDHIVPRVSFRFKEATDVGFKACWALTNLRPLWAEDNLRKRDKRIHLL